MYSAKIICDSASPAGVRLTTMEITFPRIVLAEFNTHRMFSRNSASSRAIPIEKMIQRVKENPFIPAMRYAQKGMQPGDDMIEGSMESNYCVLAWLKAKSMATEMATVLKETNCAKEIVNRLLEPFMWHTVIVTATDWANFFSLRCSPMAQLEIRTIAQMMRDLYYSSEPEKTKFHLPFYDEHDHIEVFEGGQLPEDFNVMAKISSARCARVSHLTHEGFRDINKDLELADRLLTSGHMSPFEHCAIAYDSSNTEHLQLGLWKTSQINTYASDVVEWMPKDGEVPYFGNFRGWVQYRKTLGNEDIHIGD